MESRIQCGDLHPSHKISPGVAETLYDPYSTGFAPLEYVRKRGTTAHFINPGKGLTVMLAVPVYIIRTPAFRKLTVYFRHILFI